jgi:hypothetical protein
LKEDLAGDWCWLIAPVAGGSGHQRLFAHSDSAAPSLGSWRSSCVLRLPWLSVDALAVEEQSIYLGWGCRESFSFEVVGGGLLAVEVEVATCYVGLLRDAECQELTVFCHSLIKCG